MFLMRVSSSINCSVSVVSPAWELRVNAWELRANTWELRVNAWELLVNAWELIVHQLLCISGVAFKGLGVYRLPLFVLLLCLAWVVQQDVADHILQYKGSVKQGQW